MTNSNLTKAKKPKLRVKFSRSWFRGPIAAAIVAVLSAGALSGCVTDQNTKQVVGSVVGAGLGGWGGSKVGSGRGQMAAIAVGTLAGGLLGNSLGQSLDRADQAYAQKAQWQASSASIGETIAWSNPKTGNKGRITPTREGHHRKSGAYCREYQTEVIVGGEAQVGYGTACRMPDGDWKIQS